MKTLTLLVILFFCSISLAGDGGGDDGWDPQQDQAQEYWPQEQEQYYPPQDPMYPNTGAPPIIVVDGGEDGFNWLWTTVIIPLVIAYVGMRMSAKKNKKE
tara:strand:- start:227 stop:526 length:300 start_codon:yes stop_codon:yes gene_type:complete